MTTKPPGKFIVLEGVRGAGCTEQLHRVAAGLRRQGIDLGLVSNPIISEITNAVIRYSSWVRTTDSVIDPRAELLMMVASRRITLDNAVKPALAEGSWIIADGFIEGDYAKYVVGKGVAADFFFMTAGETTDGVIPDLVLLLDIPDATSIARKSTGDDIALVVHNEQIRQFSVMPYHVLVDCTGTIEESTQAIVDAINEHFKEKGTAS